MPIEESALVVLVPESEGLVGEWRRRYDPAANYGVPAHVTVLYPFVPPRLIDDALTSRLRELFGGARCFDFTLESVRRFGDQILYLAPSPATSFELLTQAVVEAFPDYPPYEGQHEKVVAHLTVTDGAPLDQLAPIESAVGAGLPIFATAVRVSLLIGRDEPGTWLVRDEFSLGN
jgi:hypothetical protein